MIEMPWSPMAWVQICNPAASAFIMRSRISETGCISSESRPRLFGWLMKGSNIYAVRRTERAVSIGLQSADAEIWSTERVPDADLCLVIHAWYQRRGIDTRGQLAALQQLGVDGNVFIFRIHVLHAGDAERRGVGQGALHRLQPLLVRQRRNDFVDVVHGGVFQRAGWIALRVAHDHAAGRVRSLRRDAGQSQGDGVRQGHVAVVAGHEHGRISSVTGSINSFVGILGGLHLVSSQSPPRIHSPFGVFLARSPIRAQIPRHWWRRSTAPRQAASLR